MEEGILTHTAEISVSRSARLECRDLAMFLHKHGIISNVTKNITTQPNMEYGCKIIQPVTKKRELETTWQLIKKEFNFDCAHLKIDTLYSGCILDYLRPSLCGKNIEN